MNRSSKRRRRGGGVESRMRIEYKGLKRECDFEKVGKQEKGDGRKRRVREQEVEDGEGQRKHKEVEEKVGKRKR